MERNWEELLISNASGRVQKRNVAYGNGDHSANVTRLEELEEMQGSIVRRRMPTKLIKPAMLFTRQKRWLQRNDKKIGLR